MERLVRFFVERPLLVNVITLAIAVLGVGTALSTNVEGFPDAQMPRFIVTANLPGASARDVETKVTIPIENELREIDGLENFTTVISDNRSVTNIELDDDTPEALHARIQVEEHEAYPEALRLLAAGRLQIVGRSVRVLTV